MTMKKHGRAARRGGVPALGGALFVVLLAVTAFAPAAARPEPDRDAPGSGLSDAPAPVAPPATSPATALAPETAKQVRALVVQLSDEQWRARDEAERSLLALGPDVEPLLRELAKETAEPEAAARLRELLRQFAGSRWTGPALVTLRLKDAPPRRAFEEIFRQAGGEFTVHPVDLLDPNAPPRGFDMPHVSVDFDRTTFWAALKDVCNKTGMNARNVYDRHRITLTREDGLPPMKGPAFIEGPVMVVAESVNMAAGLRFANPEGTRQEGGSLTLQVFTEPRLRVVRGHFEPEAIEDDKGENLRPPRPEQARPGAASANELQQAADYAWQLSVPMRLPVRGGTKLRTFRGKLHLFAHAETQRAEVAEVLGAKEQTRVVGGKRFTVHAVTPAADGMYNVQMTLFRDNVSDEDWKWFHYPYGRVRLLDSRGRDLSTASGGGGGGSREPSASFAVQFRRESHANAADDQPGEPFKLVWDLPAKTRELVVPVSFEDLPLP